jgi:hypothetical protein
MVTACTVEHPFASVTVHDQVPAGRLFAVAPFCMGAVFHWKVYGPVPPEAFTVALPFEPPKQLTERFALVLVLRGAAGWTMVTFVVLVQPCASVTVQVHVPAARLIAEAVFCTGLVLH